MQVQQILNDKPVTGVITVKPGTSVSDVAKLLSEKRIGGVVVSENGETVAGILSERDIVRALAASGVSCLDGTAESLMTKAVEVCALDEDTDKVLARMTNGRFRHMPVVRDGAMIGLISIGDVVKAQISELAMEKDALQGMIMGY
ncbi:CBS domain-containing protein [Salipiger mucosus]|uniref:Inosine-5'-monophosphate dehydrogenase n=1 Tax=Salipiger mucosus DSM 16094 TaxID=1123237 RepID=S9QFX5_9RHOB|nr:CBS domain-containing protein [Salipiger mucosus]EPX78493.1 Inosine-5'-monophosphate dehydrogenase [Salipiger mucosus DSM 16094]